MLKVLRAWLVAGLLLPATAHATFLAPQCIDVSLGRFDRAEIVGIGTITDIDCKCAGTKLTCDKTLFLNEITKGQVPASTVHVHESFELDFDISPSYCRDAESGIRHHIGDKEIYFLQKAKTGYTALPAQKCLPPE